MQKLSDRLVKARPYLQCVLKIAICDETGYLNDGVMLRI